MNRFNLIHSLIFIFFQTDRFKPLIRSEPILTSKCSIKNYKIVEQIDFKNKYIMT